MIENKIEHKEALENLRFIAENITQKQWQKLTGKIENIRKYISQQANINIENKTVKKEKEK